MRYATGVVLAATLGPDAARSEELSGSVTVYGWLPWIDAEVTSRSGGGSAETSISAGDVLEALKFAFMAAGEVHYGRIGLIHDTVYADLGNDGSLSGPLSANVEVDTTMLLSTTALSYKVYEQDGYLVAPFAGARYVNIETDVQISGGGPIGVSAAASIDVDWWDPVVGVRGRVPVTDKLSAAGFVDIGGFGTGSEFTWEIFGGIDYAISDRVSAVAGFRYISIDYEASAADVDLDTYGPVMGLTVRF
ncbi:MAG: hypothetical protein OEN23_18180 [Paracoccaceae bacterium]|nr:hypothetical protein [Paracoccaceae bacterium]